MKYRPRAVGAMVAVTWLIPACLQTPWVVGYGQTARREDGTLMVCYVTNFGDDKVQSVIAIGALYDEILSIFVNFRM
jgi:hypothetical protein